MIIYVNTHSELCLKRNKTRTGIERVRNDIIQNMDIKFQKPNPNKYNWEKYYEFNNNNKGLNFNISNKNVISLLQSIKESWNNVSQIKIIDVEYQNKCRNINLKNLKHQTDIKLRKIISKYMEILKQNNKTPNNTLNAVNHLINIFEYKINAKMDLKLFSKKLIEIKNSILNDVNSCIIDDDMDLKMQIELFEQQFEASISNVLGFQNSM